jgi:hypothetical protein
MYYHSTASPDHSSMATFNVNTQAQTNVRSNPQNFFGKEFKDSNTSVVATSSLRDKHQSLGQDKLVGTTTDPTLRTPPEILVFIFLSQSLG